MVIRLNRICFCGEIRKKKQKQKYFLVEKLILQEAIFVSYLWGIVYFSYNELSCFQDSFFCTGVLCHFEDLMLKGQYFIDPQWLSDQLAKVVSAQELRNIAADGMYSLHELCKITGKKKVREKSRECHNYKPQPFPDPKRKRKPTNLNKHKPNKHTKSTKINSLFPK